MRSISEKLTKHLSNAIINVKDNGFTSLDLQGQLDPSDYVEVKEALSRINGKWNRSSHVFDYDPTEAINKIIATKRLPEKNPTAFFPTPESAVATVWSFISDFNLEKASYSDEKIKLLEPSAGVGAMIDYARDNFENYERDYDVDMVEYFEPNQDILKAKGYNPICGSFLDLKVPETLDEQYDIIIMNPPFSVKEDKTAYMTHLYHAFSMLKPMGNLVAIIPTGWFYTKNKKNDAFRNFISEYIECGGLELLEKGTFKESGTNVETVIISLQTDAWRKNEYSGHATHHQWSFAVNSLMTADENGKDRTQHFSNKSSKAVNNDEIKSFILSEAERLIREGFVFLSTEYMSEYIKQVRNWVWDEDIFKEAVQEDISPISLSASISSAGNPKQTSLFDFL